MTTQTPYPHLALAEGQSPRLLRHSRVRVAQIVMDYLAHGWSPEEICRQYPHLIPAEIHAAMAYYYDHRQEIDAEIQNEAEAADESRASSTPSPFALRMKSQGRL